MKITLLPVLLLLVFMDVSGVTAETQQRAARTKRQNPGDAVIDAVFQIPIQTLSAVGTLVKTTRPIFMQVRQRIEQAFVPRGGHPHRFSFPGSSGQQQQASNRISAASYNSRPYQQPTASYNSRPYQQPTASYNKLYQRPTASYNQQPNRNFNKLHQQPNHRNKQNRNVKSVR